MSCRCSARGCWPVPLLKQRNGVRRDAVMLHLNSVFERFQAGHIHIIIYHQYIINNYITILKFNLNNLVQRQFLLGFVPGLWGPFGTNKFLPFLPCLGSVFHSKVAAAVLLGSRFLGAFGLWYLWFLRTNIAFQDSKLQKTTQCEHRGRWSNMIQHDPTVGPTWSNYGPKFDGSKSHWICNSMF